MDNGESIPFPSLTQAARLWLRIGCLSFGGPAGQIALLHREVVDQRRWISESRFLHALNFCTLLPGPEAQQLAIYLGWLLHGVTGGIIAGGLFVIPGALVMLGISILYVTLGTIPLVAALFFGFKSAVLVIVLQALARIGKRALKSNSAWALAVLAFIALFFFAVPFPAVVLLAGLVGLLAPARFAGGPSDGVKDTAPALLDLVLAKDPGRARRLAAQARFAGFAAIAAWLLPVAFLTSAGGVYGNIAWFFSKMAVVTFGGAYAVLAYVAQDAVEHYHWLSPADMLAGLGLAETTPGPLILVLQFVGFLAGYHAGGWPGGIAASALTLWVTFVPCFALVFLGAPLIERLRDNRALSGALAAITAAIVGVIANLAVWFALHALFGHAVPVHAALLHFDAPVLASFNPWMVLIVAVAAVALLRLKLGVTFTLGLSVITSLGLHLAFGVA